MIYLLDANTYIEAKNRYYQSSFCPAYWDWLDHQFGQGNLASIAPVFDELSEYGDDLSKWVKQRKAHFFDVSSEDVQEKFAEVAEFVATMNNKSQAEIARFLRGADPWLVAKAVVLGGVVVTHESLVDDAQAKRVKLPNVCKKFGVAHMDTFQLLNVLAGMFTFQKH